MKACLFLVIPFVVFLLLFIVLYILFNSNFISFNALSMVSFMGFIVALLTFIYISFRISFIYMILLDKKDVFVFEKAKNVVNTSRDMTRGIVIVPFLFLALCFGLLTSPFQITENSINQQ